MASVSFRLAYVSMFVTKKKWWGTCGKAKPPPYAYVTPISNSLAVIPYLWQSYGLLSSATGTESYGMPAGRHGQDYLGDGFI